MLVFLAGFVSAFGPQSGWQAQEFLKRKTVGRGMVMSIWIRRGTWSLVKRVSDESAMAGKVKDQEVLMKTLSSFSKVGLSRLLDKVYCLSSSGISMSVRVSTVWLNMSASFCLKLQVFLSSEQRMRLKSPKPIQGVGPDGWAS